MLPFYARMGSAETERPVHHRTAFGEGQRQGLRRGDARGALGTVVSLPIQPHTHGWVGGVSRPRRAR
jgi:hypothetical protein